MPSRLRLRKLTPPRLQVKVLAADGGVQSKPNQDILRRLDDSESRLEDVLGTHSRLVEQQNDDVQRRLEKCTNEMEELGKRVSMTHDGVFARVEEAHTMLRSMQLRESRVELKLQQQVR